MQNVPMTLNGANKLKKELEFLKKIRRPEIIQLITDARKYGDLKENSEYISAKEQQIFCENRINEIERKLSYAKIIDTKKSLTTNHIIFGSTVEIENLIDKKTKKYCIVGEEEADIKCGKISIFSPIARSLIGKKIGEIVYVKTPKGTINYKIINIEHI